MTKISIFPKGKFSQKTNKYVPAVTPFTSIEFDDYLNKIKEGEFQDEILKYRSNKITKTELRGVTASGTFSYRSAKNLTSHSGFISMDIDVKDQIRQDFNEIKNELKKDNYIYSFHHSAGGFGLVAYIKIDAEKHLDSFISLEQYFLNTYNIIIDKSCKDVSRYRFVSYDPDLYLNKKSKTWKRYLPKKKQQPKINYIFSDNDLDHVFQQISDKGTDLTNDYSDWYKIGGALHDHYGFNRGLDLFHLVSQNSPKYDSKAVDDLFKIIDKRKADKIAKIGTFLWLCKNAGLEIKTKRTETIERIAKTRRKSVGKNGGAKDNLQAKKDTLKYLQTQEGYEGADVESVVDKVFELPEKDLNEKSNDLIADLEAFLKLYDLKFNEITRNYEINGEPMTDRDYNSIYINSLKQVDDKVTKDKLFSLIDSENTESYSPFKLFFEKYKHLKPTGNYDKLVSCFNYNQVAFYEGREHDVNDYVEIFLKKWLLGIVSSMNGVYSLLVLVLTGGQGNGKTKFFRNLLPDELLSFYAESKLDEGKDSEILMTKKILILDDEFGGKSKQDAKRLKELSSKQWFNVRRPYGRTSEDLRRLAVLCGTSNDDEVINDPTGNRRIIPINVIDIDHDKMEEINKIDLFMELYNEWKEKGDEWMLTKRDIELLNLCTSFNEQPSTEEEMILKFYSPTKIEGGNYAYLTNTEIVAEIKEKHPTLPISPYKMGLNLKKLGFIKTRKKFNGNTKTVYLVDRVA